MMATIIPFAPRRRTSVHDGAEPGPACQILFFTGVRYERPVEPPAKSQSKSVSKALRRPRQESRRRPG